MCFEWDERKAAVSSARHAVSFHDAATLFGDSLELKFIAAEHSATQQRLLSFGVVADGRLSVVSHMERKGGIQFISAGLMTPQERRQYVQC